MIRHQHSKNTVAQFGLLWYAELVRRECVEALAWSVRDVGCWHRCWDSYRRLLMCLHLHLHLHLRGHPSVGDGDSDRRVEQEAMTGSGAIHWAGAPPHSTQGTPAVQGSLIHISHRIASHRACRFASLLLFLSHALHADVAVTYKQSIHHPPPSARPLRPPAPTGAGGRIDARARARAC